MRSAWDSSWPLRAVVSGRNSSTVIADPAPGAGSGRLQCVPEFPCPGSVGGRQMLFGCHGDDEDGIAGRAFAPKAVSFSPTSEYAPSSL